MRYWNGLRTFIQTLLLLAGAWAGTVALAAEPRVPYQDDVLVYDPGTHERGLPEVEFYEGDAGLQLDVSRTLHVHRFYYNGDREFQFRLVQGGPTTVVTNHPRTGERLYIDVDLPSGIPVIAYNKHSITYAFPNKRVIIEFPTRLFKPYACPPVVRTELHKGAGPVRNLRTGMRNLTAKVRVASSQDPLVGAVRDTATSVTRTATGVVGTASAATGTAINQVRGTVEQLPIISQAQQAAEERGQRGQQVAIDRVTRASERSDRTSFFKTNR